MPGEGATVALVRGRTPTEALDILGPDREVGPAPAGLVREWAADQQFQRVIVTALEAGELGLWTLVVELNGFRATDKELLRHLSAQGEAVVIYENVNALSRFLYARSGEIVRDFDPLLDDSEHATFRLPEEEGINFPGDHGQLRPMQGAFHLTERLTGVRLTLSDLKDPAHRIAVGIRP